MDDQDVCGRAAAYLARPDSDERLPPLSVQDAPVLTDFGGVPQQAFHRNATR